MILGRDERGVVEIAHEDFDVLARTWQIAWKGLMNTIFDSQGLIQRTSTDALFFFWYDTLQECDKNFLPSEYSMQRVPVFLVETVTLRTEGVYEAVPRTWRELYYDGKGRTPTSIDDTLIAVDATALPSRWGGITASTAMNVFLNCVAELTSYQWLWTYTPNVPGIKRWHQKLGAEETGHFIIGAREGYTNPDVMMMDYSKILAERRSRKILA
ncbi:hypothetical protein HY483_03665 [Candidatus Woesearchaeota archaeon]|nr:hypothetical protein [Candidatus Woesearchaeota archaeon]